MPSSRVEKFLAGTAPPRSGRLVFALDATASRERTWDTAAQLQVEMFRSVAGLGLLDVQLVYFRGLQGVNAECKSSPWVGDAVVLARLMAKIKCVTGTTQIARVLGHVSKETAGRKVDAVVYVGDACEEPEGLLEEAAVGLGVPVFILQEGDDEVAGRRFFRIASLTGGAVVAFSPAGVRELGELLKAIAAFAVGGIRALEAQGSAASRLLLGRMGK